jgi:hypothetical protein
VRIAVSWEKGRKQEVGRWGFVLVFIVFALGEWRNLNSHLLIKFCGLKHNRRGLVVAILEFNLVHILPDCAVFVHHYFRAS